MLHMIYLATFPRTHPSLTKDVPIARPDRSPKWTQLTHGVWIPTSEQDGSHFGFDPITRARAFLLAHPKAVASHFAALALHRVRWWVGDQPSHFYASHSSDAQPYISKRRHRTSSTPLPICHPDPDFPEFQAVRPNVALAGCLKLLELDDPGVNTDQWYVPFIQGLSSTEIRQIQLADATRAAAQHAGYPVRGSTKGHCDKVLYRHILSNSNRGCQSPQETIMRLMIEQCVDPSQWVYLAQVEVTCMGKRVTVLDGLLIPSSLKDLLQRSESPSVEFVLELHSEEWWALDGKVLAFQYDGQHHWDRAQRDKDFRISGLLDEYSLIERRLTANDLRNFYDLKARILRWLPAQ